MEGEFSRDLEIVGDDLGWVLNADEVAGVCRLFLQV